MQAADFGFHLLAERPIECAERLVHEQKARFEHEGTGECDTLLLAARELGWQARAKSAEAYSLESGLRSRQRLAPRNGSHSQRESDVAHGGHVREQRVVLKDDADAATFRRQAYDRVTVEENVACVWRCKAGNDHERRRLARTRRTEEGHELAVPDIERYAVECWYR